MKVNRFEDLVVWQESRILVGEIYRTFNASKDFGFKDQIQRAAVSVMNNIAEGFERQSNKEFIRFLYISRASCGEVRSMLYVAKDLKYIDITTFENLHGKARKISISIYNLIKSIES
ncbi:four helix bundle protein [Saccharicrinis aurantiacus]|uniref:four helix bundle protein n=1 Tax=Saccharicrinis aurantiacus TaxID=1849719 RepID=UPI0024928E5D|nr:four helix bundle protein [Saccharicrinis aurantiacus]